jgi:hypothetical protein
MKDVVEKISDKMDKNIKLLETVKIIKKSKRIR